jgi:hypothetical protein
MNYLCYVLAIASLACWQPVRAQIVRDEAEARALYQQTNEPATARSLRATLAQQNGFLGDGSFQYGALCTYDGLYRPTPGLRYQVGLHLLEAQDPAATDSTHLWPTGSLRGFDLGDSDNPGEVAWRRFRTRLVKDSSSVSRRDFVEVLTALDAGPLLLAWVYSAAATPTPDGRYPLVATLVAGPGLAGAEPLHSLELSQAAVLRLFADRADDVRAFATAQHLDYTRPTDIARMADYYNRVAAVQWHPTLLGVKKPACSEPLFCAEQ